MRTDRSLTLVCPTCKRDYNVRATDVLRCCGNVIVDTCSPTATELITDEPIDEVDDSKYNCRGRPGTALKQLLSALGIDYHADCTCEDLVRSMNMEGIPWCEQNAGVIVDHMVQQAAKRKWLGTLTRIAPKAARYGAARLVKRAIRLAR